jgi:hypothetical protein
MPEELIQQIPLIYDYIDLSGVSTCIAKQAMKLMISSVHWLKEQKPMEGMMSKSIHPIRIYYNWLIKTSP